MIRSSFRPALSLPFTVLPAANRVRLIAGEDLRITLEGNGLETWLPNWLAGLDGHETLVEALSSLEEPQRDSARLLVERLYGQRVLVDGPPAKAHAPSSWRLSLEGAGSLIGLLERRISAGIDEKLLPVLCQDRLDFAEAIAFNRRCLRGNTPWFWITTAPMARGYVSPAFLPDTGPCLECLIQAFKRLSPLAELYDELMDAPDRKVDIKPSPCSEHTAAILAQIMLAKLEWLSLPEPSAALFQLHVVEAGTLEVTTHRVFVDPNCPSCGTRR